MKKLFSGCLGCTRLDSDFWYDPIENLFMGRLGVVDTYVWLQVTGVSKMMQNLF